MGTYSRGNKRKLATAVALVGDPAVVSLVCEGEGRGRVRRVGAGPRLSISLLPGRATTGTDPGARRFLSNSLLAVVPTSHMWALNRTAGSAGPGVPSWGERWTRPELEAIRAQGHRGWHGPRLGEGARPEWENTRRWYPAQGTEQSGPDRKCSEHRVVQSWRLRVPSRSSPVTGTARPGLARAHGSGLPQHGGERRSARTWPSW